MLTKLVIGGAVALVGAACGREDTSPQQRRPDQPAAQASAPVASASAAPQPVEGAELVPPGVAARPGAALGAGEVALEYDSRDSPDRILAWYRASARQGRIALGSELEEGAEHVLEGQRRGKSGAFTVRLAPGERGGTAAMVLITPR